MEEKKKTNDNTIRGAIIGGVFAVIAALISLIPSFREEIFGKKEPQIHSTEASESNKPSTTENSLAPAKRKRSLTLSEQVRLSKLSYEIDRLGSENDQLYVDFSIINHNDSPISYEFDKDMVEIIDENGIPFISTDITTRENLSLVGIALLIRPGITTKIRAFVPGDYEKISKIKYLNIDGKTAIEFSSE